MTDQTGAECRGVAEHPTRPIMEINGEPITIERIRAHLARNEPGQGVLHMHIEEMYLAPFYIEWLLDRLAEAQQPRPSVIGRASPASNQPSSATLAGFLRAFERLMDTEEGRQIAEAPGYGSMDQRSLDESTAVMETWNWLTALAAVTAGG
jgi:hypothetical protein